jgi:translation initiation factor IF-1
VVGLSVLLLLAAPAGVLGGAVAAPADESGSLATLNDQFESNDDPQNGTEISSGSYTALTAEAGGDDYFRVEVEAGEELSAHIDYDESVARPTLAVLEPDNFGPNVLNEVSDADGNDSVGATVDERGTYLVRVRGGDEAVGYDLTVDVSANGTAGKTDQFEPDSEASTGSKIGSGTYRNILAESGDDDYFRVEVDEEEELSAHIAYDETVARPTLTIAGPGSFGLDIRNTVENPDGNDSIGATFDSPGTYFVRVRGGEADVRYDLTVDVSANGTAGVMDEFEPDGSPDTASLVGSGTYEDLFVEPSGADYFAVDLREGEELSAHIAYDETVAQPALAVYDQSGEQVRAVQRTDGNDSVGLRAGSTGTYYVGVTGGDADVRYDLTIDADANGTAGVVDRFEPNGVPATASEITPDGSRLRNLVAEDGESDYYEVPVESGSVLSARLQYDETEGQPGLAFYDGDGAVVTEFNSSDATGDDILNATISSGGTYYVGVVGGEVDVRYDLTVSAGDEPIAPTPTPTATPTPADDDTDEEDEGDGGDGSDGGDGDGGDGGDDGDDTGTSGGSGPGFGVAALVTALLAFALLARRRS